VGFEATTEQMIRKMQLVYGIHKSLLENVEQARKKQCKVYACNYLLVLNKKVYISRCENQARRIFLLVVGKVFIILLVTRMGRSHRNKMKEARLAK
jgi:hypothetical protein